MRGDRMLKIVLLLQSRGRLSTRQLAGELEVTPRTVSRDLEALGQSGIPIVAHRGRFGGWSLLDGYRSTLTGMTPNETSALLLRASSGPLQDLGLGGHYEAALHKLRAAYPEPERQGHAFLRRLLIDEAAWHDRTPGVPEALEVCQDALWAERRLRFGYVKEQEGAAAPAPRTVEPLGLAVKRGVWYVVARDRGVIKTFRVSRMINAERLDEPFDYPADFDLAGYWQASLEAFPAKLPRYEAELSMQAQTLEIVRAERYVRVLREEALENGACAVRADLATPEFALRFLLGLGSAVKIDGPQALKEAVAREAERVAGMYRE